MLAAIDSEAKRLRLPAKVVQGMLQLYDSYTAAVRTIERYDVM